MLRVIFLGAVSLTIATGCHRSTTATTSRGGGSGVRGTLESVDAVTGTLTVKVRSRQNQDGEVKTFQVEEDTTITSFTGENKRELMGKAGLSDPQFKRGSRVSISTEDGSKAASIQVGDVPRRGGRNRGDRSGRGPA